MPRFPVICRACQRTASLDRIPKDLVCVCGSRDVDLDEEGMTAEAADRGAIPSPLQGLDDQTLMDELRKSRQTYYEHAQRVKRNPSADYTQYNNAAQYHADVLAERQRRMQMRRQQQQLNEPLSSTSSYEDPSFYNNQGWGGNLNPNWGFPKRDITQWFRCADCLRAFQAPGQNIGDPPPPCPNCGSATTAAVSSPPSPPIAPDNSRTPIPMATRASLHVQAKINEIMRGVLQTNPGMDAREAMVLARETVSRFPRVASYPDGGFGDFPAAMPSGSSGTFGDSPNLGNPGLKMTGVPCPRCGQPYYNPQQDWCPRCGFSQAARQPHESHVIGDPLFSPEDMTHNRLEEDIFGDPADPRYDSEEDMGIMR